MQARTDSELIGCCISASAVMSAAVSIHGAGEHLGIGLASSDMWPTADSPSPRSGRKRAETGDGQSASASSERGTCVSRPCLVRVSTRFVVAPRGDFRKCTRLQGIWASDRTLSSRPEASRWSGSVMFDVNLKSPRHREGLETRSAPGGWTFVHESDRAGGFCSGDGESCDAFGGHRRGARGTGHFRGRKCPVIQDDESSCQRCGVGHPGV
jgi:hypothetical protein